VNPVRVVFTTLFLGLVTGPQVVELGVEGRPARIEISLDGAVVRTLTAAPWRAAVDFGADPVPRELIATAFDAKGVALESERQFVNLARPPAEIELLVERDQAGRPRFARVAWGNVAGRARPAIEIRLDGTPLALDPEGRAALPPLETGPARVLSAEVRFSDAVVARRDVVLGGEYGDEDGSEGTALVLVAPAPPRGPEALAGALSRGGAPVEVVAVERGPAQVLVVRAPSAALAARRLRGVSRRPSKFTPSFDDGATSNRIYSGDPQHLRFDLALGREDRIRILWPVATRSPGASLPTRLFDATRDYTAEDGGLLWMLTSISHPAPGEDRDRIADAVAVAGLQAMAGGRRRAVILVLGDETRDRSFYLPTQARGYLAALRVPLFVWSLEEKPSELAREWGAVEDISSPAKLRRAVGALRKALDAQRVVWLPGLHLPTQIELTAAARARGLAWAGEKN
jgi:hypothetical protein